MKQWKTFLKALQLQRAFSTSQSPKVILTLLGQHYMTLCSMISCVFTSANKTVLAENYFFPSNFTDVDLPEAKLTAADFKLTPDNNNIITVSYITDIACGA